MIGHEAALALAGGAPAFRPTQGEAAELAAHLASCAGCAAAATGLRADLGAIARIDPGPLPARLRDRIQDAAVSIDRRGPSPLVVAVVLGLLAAAMIGASIGVGAFVARQQPEAPLLDAAGARFRWRTPVVELAADALRIETAAGTFTGDPGATSVDGDPGNLAGWTLEASWTEHGVRQRLNLYFAADDRSWWIRELRVYDGRAAGEWVTFPAGPYAATPLGQAWAGALDVTGTDDAGKPARLALSGLRIAVRPDDHVTVPAGGGIRLGSDADNPFGPSGSLRCSGILQLPPIAAEARLLQLGYRLSWRWEYLTGRFAGGSTGVSEVRDRAPATGWIADTAVGSEGELIVFVEDPSNPFRLGPPPALPADCPAPSAGP